MDGTVLVAFATKHGSTAGIAEAVAEVLRQAGLRVDVSPAGQVSALDGYGAIIVGSAVYMNRWQKEGTDFLKRFRHELASRPTWLFSSGPTGGTEEAEAALARVAAAPTSFPAPKDIDKWVGRIGARNHATFGGRVGADMTSILEKWMPRGEWRDFDAIRVWASEIATSLDRAVVR